MKKIFTTLFAATIALASPAQITLDQNAFSNTVIDTYFFAMMQPPYPPLSPAANEHWDLSGAVYENKYYSLQTQATNANFPNATWYALRRYQMGTGNFLDFYTNRWSGITAAGLERIGEEVLDTLISLASLSGANPGDTLSISHQYVPYPAPYQLIKFPATYNSTWTGSFEVNVDMKLTYGAYVDADFRYKTATTYNFDCNGWGTALVLRKPEVDGYGEDSVLMVRISGTTTDSFFLNGAPAPSGLLSAMGLVQNKTSTNHFDELFRDNEVSALVIYYYGADPTFTNITRGEVHQQRLPFPASVKSISADGQMTLYPNPVNGRRIFVKLSSAAAGDYTYKVSRIDGAVATSGTLDGSGKKELEIALPETMSNGIYWLSLYDKQRQMRVAPFRLEQ